MPAPDYPLWTAAVTLAGGRAVHYPCRPENGFVPDPDDIAKLVTPRTRALVIINPNNPTGAVYPKEVVEGLVRVAERHQLVLFSDEIYDRILYDDAEHVARGVAVREHALRHVRRALQGLSRVWVPHRLAVFQRQEDACDRLHRGHRAARFAAALRQRARPVGGADRARRRAEHLRPDGGERAARSSTPRAAARHRALEVPRVRHAARRAVRLPWCVGEGRSPSSPTSTIRSSPWSSSSASTCSWCLARASTSNTGTTSGSRSCRMTRPSRRSSSASSGWHYAARFASNAEDRRLRLVHVHDGSPALHLPERIERIAEECRRLGVTLEPELHVRGAEGGGRAAHRGLVPPGRETTLVCGTRARPRKLAFLAGTVSARLLEAARFRVVALRVVQPGVLGQPGRVLLPLAERAAGAAHALPLFRLLGGDLRRLHVLFVRELSRLRFVCVEPLEALEGLLENGRAFVARGGGARTPRWSRTGSRSTPPWSSPTTRRGRSWCTPASSRPAHLPSRPPRLACRPRIVYGAAPSSDPPRRARRRRRLP